MSCLSNSFFSIVADILSSFEFRGANQNEDNFSSNIFVEAANNSFEISDLINFITLLFALGVFKIDVQWLFAVYLYLNVLILTTSHVCGV